MVLDSGLRRPSGRFDLYGLVADSGIDLGLPRADRNGQLVICKGNVEPRGMALFESDETPTFGCYKHGNKIFLVWEDAKFSVTRDCIVVDADHEETATQLLLPAVWSVVLAAHQRESLHGSAVARLGRAVAVLGQSGSGKSTAARNLVKRNWQLVSDDLLTFDTRLRVFPGPPWLRIVHEDVRGVRGCLDPGGKIRMHAASVDGPVPLSTIIVMDTGFDNCARLTGTSAVSALFQQVYNPVLTHEGQSRRRFDLIQSLAASVPVYGAPHRSLTALLIEEIVDGGLQ